jgi:hypothetical protein
LNSSVGRITAVIMAPQEACGESDSECSTVKPSGHFHEFGDGAGCHLFHDVGAVEFNRFLDSAEFGGDLFIEEPRDDAVHDFALARSEQVVMQAQGGQFIALPPGRPIAFESNFDGLEQFFDTNRFQQKIDRASFHGFDGGADVGMSGDENQREIDASPGQFFLQPKAAHARQLRGEDSAGRAVGPSAAQKVGALLKALDGKTGGAEVVPGEAAK